MPDSGAGDAVEDVAAKRVALGEVGVVEFAVVVHANFFHDSAGREIGGDGEGNDFLQAEVLEAVVEDGACAFGGEALIVMGRGETPADFHTRGEVGVEVGDSESDEADELLRVATLGGVEGEAMGAVVGVDFVHHLIAALASERGGEIAHDVRVAV